MVLPRSAREVGHVDVENALERFHRLGVGLAVGETVDTRTETLLQHAMAALRTDRTSFVIAHRLSTIRDADLILVMENGRIVEQGNHDELIALDAAYAALYNAQFSGPNVMPTPPEGPGPR